MQNLVPHSKPTMRDLGIDLFFNLRLYCVPLFMSTYNKNIIIIITAWESLEFKFRFTNEINFFSLLSGTNWMHVFDDFQSKPLQCGNRNYSIAELFF